MSKKQYTMTCLVARFTHNDPAGKYLLAAFHALQKKNRTLIDEIIRDSEGGKALVSDLSAIVEIRNGQAQRVHRPELPEP
jgi:hypothetical protein